MDFPCTADYHTSGYWRPTLPTGHWNLRLQSLRIFPTHSDWIQSRMPRNSCWKHCWLRMKRRTVADHCPASRLCSLTRRSCSNWQARVLGNKRGRKRETPTEADRDRHIERHSALDQVRHWRRRSQLTHSPYGWIFGSTWTFVDQFLSSLLPIAHFDTGLQEDWPNMN